MKVKQADSFFYRIREQQTEISICGILNTSKPNILRNNNKLKYYAGEWVKVTTNDYLTHIVKPIETVDSISNLYNISSEKLIADNKLQTEKLFIGQQLKIKR